MSARWIKLLAVVAALCALGAVGCTDIVAGDSIVGNAVVSDGGKPSIYGISESVVDGVALHGFAGEAPCDYLRFSQDDYNKWHPAKISFAFSGNNLTPCMLVNGQRLHGTALVNKYHDDLAALVKWWTAKNVKVIFSAPVCRAPGSTVPNGDPAFRSMESGLAYRFRLQGKRVAYSETAARTVCPGWVYHPEFRQVDGLHLSPAGAVLYAAGLRYESKHTNP